MNGLKLFLEFFNIVIIWGFCHKTFAVDKLFNPQSTILTLSCQGIVIIVVNWSFHHNIIILVKVLCVIILMVLLIRRMGCYCFCRTYIGCSLLINLLMNPQNLCNKVVKSFVIIFIVNDCLGKFCISNVHEYNQNNQNSLTWQTCLHLLHETHFALLWIFRTFTETAKTPKQLEFL